MPLGSITVVRRSLKPASDRGDRGGASDQGVARTELSGAGSFVRAPFFVLYQACSRLLAAAGNELEEVSDK